MNFFLKSTTRIFLISVLGTILGTVLLPILYVVYIPLLVYKYLIVFPLLKAFRGQSKFISPNDCVVTLLNYNLKRRPYIVCQNLFLESYVPFKNIKEHFEKCFLTEEQYEGKYEAFFFSYSSFLGYTIKTKRDYSEYSFDKHLSEIFYEDILKEVGKGQTPISAFSPEEFNDVLAEYFLTRKEYFEVNNSDPLWDLSVINSKSGTGKTIVVIRNDHLLMDGYSMFHVCSIFANSKIEYVVKPEELELKKKIIAMLCFPFYWARQIAVVILNTELRFKPKIYSSEFPRTFITSKLKIDPIKQIRKTTGVNFSSVVRSLFAGALHSYLSDKKNVRNQPIENYDSAKYFHLASPLPWPNHPVADMSSNGKLKNHFSYGIFPTQYATKDPLQRISSVDDEHKLYEELHMRWVFHQLVFACMSLHPPMLNSVLVDLQVPLLRSGGFLSPILYSSNLGDVCGSRVTNIFHPFIDSGFARNSGNAFKSFIVAFGDEMVVNMNACKTLFPSREEGVKFLEVYFEHQIQLTLSQLRAKHDAVINPEDTRAET